MVNLMRRDPMMEAVPGALMGRLIDRFLSEPFFEPGGGALQENAGVPPVDIIQDEEAVTVRASLPGFNKDEVNVEVHNGLLSIDAQHSEEHEERQGRYLHRERRSGALSRRIALPGNLQEDQCRAELKQGVLTLTIPRSQEAGARRIEIREGAGDGEPGPKDPASRRGNGQANG
jgi:HSP20 family molecular chaperone IbpA